MIDAIYLFGYNFKMVKVKIVKKILALSLSWLLIMPYSTTVAQNNTKGSFESLNEAVQQSSFVLQLKQKLAQAQYRYYLLKSNIGNAKENLEDVRNMILNIETTIDSLELQIDEKGEQILSVKSQREEKKMELSELELEVQALELQKKEQLNLVEEFMQLIYLNREIYYKDEKINTLKVLAAPESVSKTLQGLTYLDLLEKANTSQILKLERISNELSFKWSQIRNKQNELAKLDSELSGKAERIKEDLDNQTALLRDMLGEERILETMLAAANDNEESLLNEIKALENSLNEIESIYMDSIDELSEKQQDVIAKIEEEMSQNYNIREASNVVDLQWPISPSRGITSLFSDSEYIEMFGVPHGALDIRAEHGSPVKASADGVVFDVKFDPNSKDYAYIMIAHRKGVMTLIGHISGLPQKNGREIQVGDFVREGEIIAFSGATPNSIGSGPRTTGAHVHFEVWQDGTRVDPFLYLPLEEVQESDLPDTYLNEIKSDLEQEIIDIEEALGL